MGCVESTEALSIDATDEESEPPESAHKHRSGKKSKQKRKGRASQQKTVPDPMLLHDPTETKIHVIWRRVSIFNSRRGSMRSNQSNSELNLPGTSQRSPPVMQPRMDTLRVERES